MEDLWIKLDEVGITTQSFVVVAKVNGGRNYIYYFEGTG